MRNRLENAGVQPSRYRLSTIDGWAIRLISTFPMRSGHDPRIIERERPKYPAIRTAAAALLKSSHVNDVIAASYSHLLVMLDEGIDLPFEISGQIIVVEQDAVRL